MGYHGDYAQGPLPDSWTPGTGAAQPPPEQYGTVPAQNDAPYGYGSATGPQQPAGPAPAAAPAPAPAPASGYQGSQYGSAPQGPPPAPAYPQQQQQQQPVPQPFIPQQASPAPQPYQAPNQQPYQQPYQQATYQSGPTQYPQQYPQQPPVPQYPQQFQQQFQQPQYYANPQQPYAAPPQQQPVPPQQQPYTQPAYPQQQFPQAPYPQQQQYPQYPQYPQQSGQYPVAPMPPMQPLQPAPPEPGAPGDGGSEVSERFDQICAPFMGPGEQALYGALLKLDSTIEETPDQLKVQVDGQNHGFLHGLAQVDKVNRKVNRGLKAVISPADYLTDRLAEKGVEALNRKLAGPVFTGGWESQAGCLIRAVRACREDYGPGAYVAVTTHRVLVLRAPRPSHPATLAYDFSRGTITGVRVETLKDAVKHGRTPRAEMHFSDGSMVALMMPTKTGQHFATTLGFPA